MCWNYSVSLIFFIIFLISNSYYVIKKPKYWIEYLLFGGFYMNMEIFQTSQWLFGNVREFNSIGFNKCDIVNINFTIGAHILIWLQPILFSYIGYRTSHFRRFFYTFLFFNTIIFIYSLIVLYVGFQQNTFYSIFDSNFGLSTCTNKGPTGHLVWKIKPASIDYFPNYFMYLAMCSLSFLMYDKKEIQLIGFGWAISFILTKIILQPTALEMASTWCLLSVFANMLIVGYHMIK